MHSSEISQEARIYALEKAVLVMDTRLESTEKVLIEIKNVLVEIVRLQGELSSIKKDVISIKEDIDTAETENEESKTFRNKIKGGIATFLFCFAFIQGFVLYEFNSIIGRLANVEAQVQKK